MPGFKLTWIVLWQPGNSYSFKLLNFDEFLNLTNVYYKHRLLSFLTQRPYSNIKQSNYWVFSISNNISEIRLKFVSLLEDTSEKIAQKEFLLMQPAYVEPTLANTTAFEDWPGF